MATSVSVYLTESALNAADQLVMADRRNGQNANRSTVINRVLTEAAAQLKQITPVKNGNRIIGWQAWYGDHLVGNFDGAISKPEAQRALDAFVYEELSK